MMENLGEFLGRTPRRTLRDASRRIIVRAAPLLLFTSLLHAQDVPKPAPSATEESSTDIRALADSVRALQTQVQALTSQLADVRADEQRADAEAKSLRNELQAARAGSNSQPAEINASYSASTALVSAVAPAQPAQQHLIGLASAPEDQTLEERLGRIEENEQLTQDEVTEQSQSKVESGSKYRVRLSGLILLNMFGVRGQVDNLDFPEIALEQNAFLSSGAFAGSLRQSQIGIETFGPDIFGAHTSANVKFDFAGGFPNTPNGTVLGQMRLRTGTIRFDWANTSIVAGQDFLFFAPLSPTSLASVALPPLSYAGNLWGWTPQVRIEHRVTLSESTSLLFEGGILDSLTGDFPYAQSERYPSWGEMSGEPAYAVRVAWNRRIGDRTLTFGAGGYYGRQYWGFNRNVDGWAGTLDATIPLGDRFSFTGAFYRGRGMGGLGGAIGQTVLLSGSLEDPTATVKGANSMGGWVQFKYKLTTNFEINAALGDDTAFAGQLRRFPPGQSYYGESLKRNLSPFMNFVYQPRSDVMFSVEYRWIQTSLLDEYSSSADHVDVSLGYIF